ncbi:MULTISPECIES: hypothetical protein [Brevibacillus]|uniref:Photosynthesis system II assembly factor Ycf48/Hcf136-like domain-containing protein n=1 Tax=Brevibacillus brevis TaxID=1393 RepID=A0A2Z4MCQ6_BREBE|nr:MULTISPECIES: hypothetical protein [Brevibacillus]AWX54250.1 hypothetical protein AB432_003985 [Brevibacillus brevis]NRR19775.1 hypothetical protein [Brevibacillus sp. MS2.2]RAT97880.1 hypothetical protein ASG16_009545 [Brevibacillus sp. Leaf182]
MSKGRDVKSMNSFLKWGIGVIAMLQLVGCGNNSSTGSEQSNTNPQTVTAAALQGNLTYQDVLEQGATIHNLMMTDDDKQIWVGTNSGLYSSVGGGSWGSLSTDLQQYTIEGWFVDPDDPKQIFVGGIDGVLHSTDGGKKWATVNNGLPEPANISSFVGSRQGDEVRLFAFVSGEGIYQSTDEAQSWSLWQPMDQEVFAMDFDPEQDRLYVAAQFSLLYNEEGQWKTEEIPGAEQIYSLAINRRTGTLAVATEKGIYEKIKGEWRLLDARSPEKLIVLASGGEDTKWVGIGESALIYKLEDNRWIKWNE